MAAASSSSSLRSENQFLMLPTKPDLSWWALCLVLLQQRRHQDCWYSWQAIKLAGKEQSTISPHLSHTMHMRQQSYSKQHFLVRVGEGESAGEQTTNAISLYLRPTCACTAGCTSKEESHDGRARSRAAVRGLSLGMVLGPESCQCVAALALVPGSAEGALAIVCGCEILQGSERYKALVLG